VTKGLGVNISQNRKLDAFSLAALLLSAHYGLGFLLGTAEKSLTLGAAGSLYAVCLGLGTIALLLGLAKFYWTQVEQIWTLLGNRYGSQVKILVGLMSWSSLIGIEAVQMISGAFILKVLGMPVLPSMVLLAMLFTLVSVLPVEKAGFLFRGLLVLNFLALLYGLWVLHGFPEYLRSPIEFIPALEQVKPSKLAGISLSTILLVLIDMKYQQFLVQAKDVRTLYQGCLLAAILLLLLAFLPSSVVVAAQNAGILPTDIEGKETLPFILLWIGGGTDKPLGIVMIMSLLVPALGVGSSILRVQTKTVLDFNILPASSLNRLLITAVNAILALAVALKGGEIINLIVCFYASYVAAVFVPFVAYLLDQRERYTFAGASVKLSLIMGSMSSIFMLILTFINPNLAVFGSVELNIMLVGITFGVLGLLAGQVIEKYLPTSKVSKEI
jgi:SSS family solute:Na+ symporter